MRERGGEVALPGTAGAAGSPTAFADRQIAGTEGLTILTENTPGFEPFADLSEKPGFETGIHLENWFDG